MDPLGAGNVDLDSVAEVEEPLQPRPVPDQGIEGREERASPDAAGRGGVGIQVGRLRPALNLHLADVA